MIKFSKYHGCGNNFVIVREDDLIRVQMAETAYSAFAKQVCDVNIGVGADGLIIVREEPELEMVFLNCDGSRAPMCGNGIRCFARYCREEGIRWESTYKVKTLAGHMLAEVTSEAPFKVKINMGKPLFSPDDIKVDFEGKDFLNRRLMLGDGAAYEISTLFMGTIHTVVFVHNYDDIDVPRIGEEICNHPIFKEKTNVNFVRVVDEKTLEMKTYERGVGMTLACGTGACASAVVSNMRGLCGRQTEVMLALGSLMIEIQDDGNIHMEGPSVKILDGTFYEKGEREVR